LESFEDWKIHTGRNRYKDNLLKITTTCCMNTSSNQLQVVFSPPMTIVDFATVNHLGDGNKASNTARHPER
jgi:hypothetical protein